MLFQEEFEAADVILDGAELEAADALGVLFVAVENLLHGGERGDFGAGFGLSNTSKRPSWAASRILRASLKLSSAVRTSLRVNRRPWTAMRT